MITSVCLVMATNNVYVLIRLQQIRRRMPTFVNVTSTVQVRISLVQFDILSLQH